MQDGARVERRRARAARAWGADPTCGGELAVPTQSLDPEARRRVWHAVDQLPPIHARLVSLRYREDLDVDEIGALVGLTPVQVRSKLQYALRLLREGPLGLSA